NNNNNNNVNNDNDDDDYFSDHSFNSNYEPNTNISPRLSIDSLRNQMGPAPDRTSQYGASTKQHPHAESGHNRAPSISSQKSSSSERSKNPSLAKKIYKAPLKQLSKIGRKTRNSFVVDYEKQPSDHHHHQRDVSSQYSTKSTQSNNTNNNHNSNTINSNRLSYSNASFASNASTMSSPDIRGNNEFEQNFDE
ncbi:mitotic spindle checkpoint protein Bub3, partial [Pichia californica]